MFCASWRKPKHDVSRGRHRNKQTFSPWGVACVWGRVGGAYRLLEMKVSEASISSAFLFFFFLPCGPSRVLLQDAFVSTVWALQFISAVKPVFIQEPCWCDNVWREGLCIFIYSCTDVLCCFPVSTARSHRFPLGSFPIFAGPELMVGVHSARGCREGNLYTGHNFDLGFL